jgi:hypothetical protein
LLRKKRNETVYPPPNGTVAKENPTLGHPNRARKTVTEKEVRQKYRRFWESDQAGKGIVAHDNSIGHSLGLMTVPSLAIPMVFYCYSNGFMSK